MRYLGEVLFSTGVVYLVYTLFFASNRYNTQLILFTPQQLEDARAQKDKQLLLAVLGSVFDVTKGRRHYDPDHGGYGGFAFRDATRSFVTGDFKDDLHDDCTDFDMEQYAQAIRWRDFYSNSKVSIEVFELIELKDWIVRGANVQNQSHIFFWGIFIVAEGTCFVCRNIG